MNLPKNVYNQFEKNIEHCEFFGVTQWGRKEERKVEREKGKVLDISGLLPLLFTNQTNRGGGGLCNNTTQQRSTVPFDHFANYWGGSQTLLTDHKWHCLWEHENLSQ